MSAKRNDASAVAKACKGVSRGDAAELLRQLLRARLPKARPTTMAVDLAGPVEYRTERRYDAASDRWIDVPVRPTFYVFDNPVFPTKERKQRRSPSRTDYATKQRIVEERPYGKWPRYGTARAAKTEVVKDKLKERQARDLTTKVRDLLGLRYVDPKGKSGAITFHDLQVMEEKHLIIIKEA